MKFSIVKKICITASFLASVLPLTVFQSAAAGGITLHIEGIYETVYYDELPGASGQTLQEALTDLLAVHKEISFEGLDTAYITAVNGKKAGTFGGWDGWLYRVNGAEATAGIDAYTLRDGDEIVLFYGDPYGAGMQFPRIDGSRLDERVIRIVSDDVTYDEDFNPSVNVNPVVGAEIKCYDTNSYISTMLSFTTDENGEFKIPDDYDIDSVALYINKSREDGLPLLLRNPGGNPFFVKIGQAVTENQPENTDKILEPIGSDKPAAVENPETGVSPSLVSVMFFSAVTAAAFIIKPHLRKK